MVVKVLRNEIVERVSVAPTELHPFQAGGSHASGGLRHPYSPSFCMARQNCHPYMLVGERRRAPSW